MSAWTLLVMAIAFEVAATSCLKLSDGFIRWQWGAASIVLYWACFAALGLALKTIPIGIAYAIWAGIGIVAVAAIGMTAFGQKLGPLQLLFMAMILVGAVGLRLTTPEDGRAAMTSADAPNS